MTKGVGIWRNRAELRASEGEPGRQANPLCKPSVLSDPDRESVMLDANAN